MIDHLEFCLNTTYMYLVCRGGHCQQIQGAPMGSPDVSPVDLSMEDFEQRALESAPNTPSTTAPVPGRHVYSSPGLFHQWVHWPPLFHWPSYPVFKSIGISSLPQIHQYPTHTVCQPQGQDQKKKKKNSVWNLFLVVWTVTSAKQPGPLGSQIKGVYRLQTLQLLRFPFDRTKILRLEDNTFKCRLQEVFHIYCHGPTHNHDRGYEIPSIILVFLSDTKYDQPSHVTTGTSPVSGQEP